MNVSDSEIINGILLKSGFNHTKNISEADIIFLNTCAIRENAENKIWSRLNEIKALKRKTNKKLITGVLGCMAERLKIEIVEKSKAVDIVAGPDAYRDLPNLINSLNVRKKFSKIPFITFINFLLLF
jgi:tRNA-2-methylthio-N6-dimethylallyladenosine synthase